MLKKQSSIRKSALRTLGFGIEAMKNFTVCHECNSLEPSNQMFCSKCGSRLPIESLYTLYKSQHACCSKCGSVLSSGMHFCSHCGTKQKALAK